MAVFGRAYPSIAYKQKQHVVFGVLAYHQLLPKAGLLKPEKRKPIDGRFWKQKPRLNTVALRRDAAVLLHAITLSSSFVSGSGSGFTHRIPQKASLSRSPMASNGASPRIADPENSLETIKRQLASGSGRNLLQGPLLKRSETLRKWNERWVILDPTTGRMEYKIRRNEPSVKGTILFDANSTITLSPVNFQ
ncbi:hypothetical protein ACLB2K_009858 [Fragaria x ananassa]